MVALKTDSVLFYTPMLLNITSMNICPLEIGKLILCDLHKVASLFASRCYLVDIIWQLGLVGSNLFGLDLFMIDRHPFHWIYLFLFQLHLCLFQTLWAGSPLLFDFELPQFCLSAVFSRDFLSNYVVIWPGTGYIRLCVLLSVKLSSNNTFRSF